MLPLARIRIAKRAALRRRYGYAALRVLRRGLRAALADHKARQLAPTSYSLDSALLRLEYWRALQTLRHRCPKLDTTDPRSTPQ